MKRENLAPDDILNQQKRAFESQQFISLLNSSLIE